MEIIDKKMDSHRKTATIVGILFIFAIVMLFVGEALYKPILDSPDYLDNAYPNKTVVITGILLEFTGVPAVVLLSLLLFPVLKRHNEVLALGYVVFRLFEAALLSVAYISKLSLVNLSQDYLSKGGVDASYFQYIGSSIQSVNHWAGTQGLIYHIAFALGSMMLYYVLYRSKLVPRFISAWGFIAAIALLIGSVLINIGIFAGVSEVGLELIFALPIAVAEIMLSIWLIVKGFDPSAITSAYAKTDTNEV
ncbi:DUF4386 domain-containing protein [Methanococcoides orientis]|uniref:DUF4386 domain-containing protein n=1 Tax=Methanococcoides orientis TaxID=2822137 RepID=UPI001E5C7FD2|nr:DUF4386 domain-containing protein [Methanococcoides orientis]UGV41371.1 DUF4386 domain-containing protein [Methanococcoides orientis]